MIAGLPWTTWLLLVVSVAAGPAVVITAWRRNAAHPLADRSNDR
jgi:hypothetical protein